MQTVAGGLPPFRNSIYFQTMNGGMIGLTVSLSVSAGAAIERVRHEFVKRLTARYAREGIRIP
jgi:hypothetical protein